MGLDPGIMQWLIVLPLSILLTIVGWIGVYIIRRLDSQDDTLITIATKVANIEGRIRTSRKGDDD